MSQSREEKNRVYDKLDKIEEKFERKLDNLDKRVDGVEKELIIYNEHLKTHIEGVNQARRQNDMLREYIDIEVNKLHNDFAPVIDHVLKLKSYAVVLGKLWRGTISFLGFISLISGIIYGTLRYFGIM